jgi:hypothetical protein
MSDDAVETWRKSKDERVLSREYRRLMTEQGIRPDQIAPERLPTQTEQTLPIRTILGHDRQRRNP